MKRVMDPDRIDLAMRDIRMSFENSNLESLLNSNYDRFEEFEWWWWALNHSG